ncbi:MAG: putative bifunctional diguanylate cyclase/phosphodiesterase [Acidobacteriaceae bacterium]
MLIGHYNSVLVLFSVLVAILASYTALDLAARITAAQGRAMRWWLAGGALAMGTGIWSMHFIGMLAFSLSMPMGYDPWITLLSLAIGIASSAFALWLVSQEELPWTRLTGGALLLGAGVAGMHYTGMAAMRMTPGIEYSPSLVILSLLIAVGVSGAALWMAFRLRKNSARIKLFRAGAAVIMGFAIAGMHYVGMAAAHFQRGSRCNAVSTGVSNNWLALLIVISSLAGLLIALIVSVLDARMESRTAVLAASLAEANHELTHLAMHDSLTRLPNRILLEDRLQQATENAKRYHGRFSVLFLDLDGFKAVNDSFGHSIGDRLLVGVAQRIRACIRARDTIARIGGDEFVVLLDADEPADAAAVADKLVTTIRQPFMIGDLELRVSASIGIAIYPGADGRRDLLKDADAAMYHAKDKGRNCYCFFETSMNADAQEQLQLLHDLHLALERHELVLHYQPKFDTIHRKMMGAEALVRWQHPTRGLLPPNDFIPMAEKSGLIVPIGEWVLNEACRQMNEWRQFGSKNWSIAVNLSPLQFCHTGLIQMLRDTLQRHGVEPRCLTLEVTESTAMRDVDTSMAILQQIYSMGVNISIDDFGTGYSSLLYLQRLPANELKIDRGFVLGLAKDGEDAAIVSAIVALGKSLNLKVVAEGVETTGQQEFLTRLGCDSLQGFLLGRPMPPDQFIAALSQPDFPAADEVLDLSSSWKLVAQTS